MLGSSKSKSFALVLALAAALFSAALVVARQKSESRPPDAGARGRAEALRSPDAQKRAAAAYEISKRPGEAKALVNALVELLGDAAQVDANAYRKREHWNSDTPATVGQEAARALTAAGAEAVEPLTAALARKETEARRNAAWALGAIGDRRAVTPLTETLRHDADEKTREQAAWALGAIGDRRASEAISAALNDSSADVREQAAWALGAIGDESAVPSLIASLADESPRVREQSAWALGAIGDARAADALRASLRDSDKGVREQARWALGAVGDRDKEDDNDDDR
ncbi:MAG TPA: HEAT repeat domain-containing protein [Pyrinomonadaceae bacterium]|nr:HEAT repeat domain-containing protein [Pyrinomonadaceae bacterium]